ncbi:MAG: Rrf2 family transcriptional regulator [candidate division Zixibacteria bacterium]|nr:Rrf2 family transcriptional regulator [candidate division Zixibacteria bacterium]
MQFTKAEEYGMKGVLFLADKEKEIITPLSEISEAKNIPEKFLAKIFQSLSRTGIVRSHRGVRGGFTLSRDPSEISVKEVLEAIQGPYYLMKCTKDMESCEDSEKCAIRDLFIMAENKMLGVFESHSLADMVKWQKEKNEHVAASI